jgi:hypothetical protein
MRRVRLDYTAFDDAICEYLEGDHACHPTLSDALLRRAAAVLGVRYDYADKLLWRLIDRRLQAMRRAGRIRHVREVGMRQRWEVVRHEARAQTLE